MGHCAPGVRKGKKSVNLTHLKWVFGVVQISLKCLQILFRDEMQLGLKSLWSIPTLDLTIIVLIIKTH